VLSATGANIMPLTPFLKDTAFSPEEIAVLVRAYTDTLSMLRLIERTDLATDLVARTIIEFAKQGERDPVRLRERTIEALSGNSSNVA
jgi:hypothetical protein